MMQTKVCSKCKQERCLNLFSKNKNQKDGFKVQCKLCAKKYYEENKEKVLDYFKKYREENREKVLERHKKYREENKEKCCFLIKKRKSQKLKRTPIWLSNEDFWMIEEIYKLRKIRSKETKIEWHVDHIIPLQGKNVSGLHCPDNLQLIPSVYNMSKYNKWDWYLQR